MRSTNQTLGSSASATGVAQGDDYWTKIMTPERGWFDVNFRELWGYRDLIRLFVLRDIVATYKQTILGPAWFFISPLMTAVVFTFIFGEIAAIPTDGIPPFLFYFCGTVCWGHFARCLAEISKVFLTNAPLFGKVYFPRLAVPIAAVLSSGLKFLVQLGIFMGFLFYYMFKGSLVAPNAWAIFIPLLALQAGILALAAGILISSLTVKYRDLNHFINFGIQLWMYATPSVYPLSQVPERFAWIYLFNPMVAVVEGFRYGLLGTGSVSALQVAMSLIVTLIIVLAGLALFTKTENTFMDRI